jgi:hypothetical protein
MRAGDFRRQDKTMNHHYSDIRERIAEPPKWWDECAVPRYCDFKPDETANIYAEEVALVEIQCQECATPFLVAFASSAMDRAIYKAPSIAESITKGTLHYGDPPNVGCCIAGATMNCIDVRVVEYWNKKRAFLEWERDPSLEIAIEYKEEENQ